jgi:hypothetical protein
VLEIRDRMVGQIRLKRRRVDGADAVQADGAPGVFGEGGGSKVCIPDREPASPATGAGVAAGVFGRGYCSLHHNVRW